ncbi:hypothetical protein Tco_1538347 [Tanacetum coccineum]
MTSFDYRLNPIYAIKECSSCGSLYTSNCGCSKGSLEDKILVPIPDSSQRSFKIENFCLDCGDPIHGLHCQGCALIQKTFEEVLQDFQDTSKSSDDNTNVVNAPQEPFVGNQDPGENSSPSPPHIDHCCHECGDSLDGIFCRQCTCKSCGKGAHYGYNCPPKVPIITNPEPCNTQTISEPLQNLQSLQQQCLLGTCLKCGCNEYNGVCFYCTIGNGTPSNFSTPYSSNDSPSVANHPPQPQYVPYSCEIRGNDSHYGYDCPPQVPFVYNQDPCFNQNFPQTLPSFQQQRLCCENCGGPHETFQCQPMNEDYYHEQNSCYDSNSFGFDQVQPPQYTVNHPIFNSQNELLNSQNELLNSSNKLMEQMTTLCDLVGQAIQKKEEEKRIAGRTADRFWTIPICLIKVCGGYHTQVDFSQYDSFIFDLSNDQFPPAYRSNLYHEEFADELAHIMSLLNLECFKFKVDLDLGDLTSIDLGIRKNVSTTNVNVPLEDDQSSLFAYVVWIFLAFLTYPVVPPYLLSTRNEDTIFDPGISIYHSFMPDVSHRSGTFMKFNVYPNCLNGSPMMTLSSTCSPMDQ